MSNVELVSPDHIMGEAKMHMLRGQEPSSWDDWAKVMNFIAYNVAPECDLQACRLMAIIYEMPLTYDEVKAIVLFQRAKRG
jgi:hypothetical protein